MPHTLLLADDSTTIQRVVELTFASEDIDVVTVGDGTRAIEAIERDEPDIVLVDVSMPGRDGYEVASFVRSDPARDRIPVVLLTGAFEPLDESRCDAIGRHEVLVKPFEPRQVIGKVRELLELSPADVAEAPAAVAKAKARAADPPATADTAAPAAETAEVETAEVETAEVETAEVETAEVETAETAEAVDASETVVPDAPAADAVAPGEAAAPVVEAAAAAPTEAPPVEQVAPDPSEPPAAPAADTGVEEVGEPTAPLSAAAVSGAGARIPPAGAGGSVLAEAFLTFLAVEQGADPPAPAAGDTGGDSGGAGPELQVSDAVLDELVRRVVERMSETVVRDTVAEVVSRIGERLAREENTGVTADGE